jgi:hypothetical protein
MGCEGQVDLSVFHLKGGGINVHDVFVNNFIYCSFLLLTKKRGDN